MYKKCLNYLDNHNGEVTHLEPEILECEVNWALGSVTTNKASAGDGILAELFKLLKDDAVKVLHQYAICNMHSICNIPAHGSRGIWPRDVLKKVARGLSRVEAGNPGFPRLVQVTLGGFSWWL